MMMSPPLTTRRFSRCAQVWRPPRGRHDDHHGAERMTNARDCFIPRTSLQPPSAAEHDQFSRLASDEDMLLAMDHLHRRGFLVIKLPPHIVTAHAAATSTIRQFFANSNAEKNTYRTRQDGETVLSHPGYLTPSPGWAELFEVRRSKRDVSYRFPPRCEEPCVRLFDAMREHTLRWLSAISAYLCGDSRTLPLLASKDSGPATLRAIHYDQVVEIGAQIAAIPAAQAAQKKEASRRLMAGFPAHVDSSLLTLAPRASCSGLSVRDYAGGRWIRIERHMADDEALLFCGDPIAFVSAHHFPACMHRPDALEMARQMPSTRLSTPFFLYADEEAVLDQAAARGPLLRRGAHAQPAQPGPPARLAVVDFKLNVGNCRELWPWKASEYYSGRVLCRDSDSFPGLEVECEMAYAD